MTKINVEINGATVEIEVEEKFVLVEEEPIVYDGKTLEECIRYQLHKATAEKCTITDGKNKGCAYYNISGDGFSCGGSEEDTVICKL